MARDFGDLFAAALEKMAGGGRGADRLELGRTTCACRIARRPMPPLAAVRDHVVREWENERRARATTPTRDARRI